MMVNILIVSMNDVRHARGSERQKEMPSSHGNISENYANGNIFVIALQQEEK